MKLGDKKAALFAITENIEMELFSSEERCVVIITQEKKEEDNFRQRYLEHPLVPDRGEDPEPQDQNHLELKTKSEHFYPISTEQTLIEMEMFPPNKVSECVHVERKSGDPSTIALVSSQPSPNTATRLKWRKAIPQRTGLVVKDVVCLPRGYYLTQLERQLVPLSKERAALAAMGLTARITIDSSWSANQMESRLAALFRGRFVKWAGQRFSFTYLQSVQGSRALFVPDPPAEGWTGDQVLRISAYSALHILSQHDYPQVESVRLVNRTAMVNRKEFCSEVISDCCKDEDSETRKQIDRRASRTPEESAGDLNAILKSFRQENTNRDLEIYIQVRRSDLLDNALKVLRRPGFCFRTTPIISFSGEETTGHDGPLREFFRLALLELQHSCVFRGRPGRLLLTYDLNALEDRKYYEAGVLIGWSLAQGGPGPRCLHPALYQLMCGQSPSLKDFSWMDIVDTETRIRLQELHSCTDAKLLSPSLCDWMSSHGISGISLVRCDDVPAVYSRLVKHCIYHRVASMISQFKEGLNSCGGLWDIIRSHWETFVPVITSTQQQLLTLEKFKRLFVVCFSRLDSQLRPAEEATAEHWGTVLSLVGDGQTDFSFEDLLVFITGADHLPPLGFPRLISLHFYSQDVTTSEVRLPYASTCSLELFLPRGVARAADLLDLLNRAVQEALGFTHFQKDRDGEDGCTEVMT
ncbi:uncharacterized protein LOC125009904 [Mugil cephalus]|uniref:uncharacterized protein LOC125009904 n=1 Tax=Mugil cephalus TaxID=48193 RepID=UPI001FB807FB|nr:uncharacterized protein LOC125009904 [Mugil cephalus]